VLLKIQVFPVTLCRFWQAVPNVSKGLCVFIGLLGAEDEATTIVWNFGHQ